MNTPLNHKSSSKVKKIFTSFFTVAVSILTFGVILFSLVTWGALIYYSSVILYQETYTWLKFNISMDIDLYTCLTQNTKYCHEIISIFPFNLLPESFINWLVNPTNWFGLHDLIVPVFKIPIWILGYVFALLILFFLNICLKYILPFKDNISEKNK